MNDNDIRPGVPIDCIHAHAANRPGERLVIAQVNGRKDDSTVILDLIGPYGTAPLVRTYKSIRNNFKLA